MATVQEREAAFWKALARNGGAYLGVDHRWHIDWREFPQDGTNEVECRYCAERGKHLDVDHAAECPVVILAP